MQAPVKLQWSLKQVLAAIALLLGVLAMAGQPTRGHVVTIDTQELATMVAGRVDHVLPEELADQIIRGASDYRLIDLRDEADFATYHIPTAENVPLAKLPDWGLGRNEKIILYSDGGIHAAQAWMLLRVQGYQGVTTLFGGLDAWKDEVVFPVAPVNPNVAQATQFERRVQVARHFGGQGRPATAGGEMPSLTITTPGNPAATTPSPTAHTGGAAVKKKKKEGC